jgi:hypothetical protein
VAPVVVGEFENEEVFKDAVRIHGAESIISAARIYRKL